MEVVSFPKKVDATISEIVADLVKWNDEGRIKDIVVCLHYEEGGTSETRSRNSHSPLSTLCFLTDVAKQEVINSIFSE